MRGSIVLLAMAGLAGCIDQGVSEATPEIAEGGATMPTAAAPADWKRENFVAGLSMSVPAGADVRRPQGIDSAIIVVRGSDYWLSGDDYGAFDGSGEIEVGGQPATIERRAKGVCRHDVYRIQSPRPNRLFNMCQPDGTCSHPPGQITLVAQCTSDSACATRDAIIESITFSPPPWPGHSVDPPPRNAEEADAYNKVGLAICSIE